jgi:hypothetical protein
MENGYTPHIIHKKANERRRDEMRFRDAKPHEAFVLHIPISIRPAAPLPAIKAVLEARVFLEP